MIRQSHAMVGYQQLFDGDGMMACEFVCLSFGNLSSSIPQ
jgi:hypothetical protein